MTLSKHRSTKVFYTMGEVCEMFDVSHSLIRFWESKFDVLKPKKNAKGNRLFSPSDVENLKIIYNLVKERGMTLDGAARYMALPNVGLSRDNEILDRLHSVRSMLVALSQELDSSKDDSLNEVVSEVEILCGDDITNINYEK